jgi:hypothetical protein
MAIPPLFVVRKNLFITYYSITGDTLDFSCSIVRNSIPGSVFHDILDVRDILSFAPVPDLILGECSVYLNMSGTDHERPGIQSTVFFFWTEKKGS